jgi:hypothetical protein
MPPKKAAKAAPKAKAPKVDRKYGYLPKDLQRAAQHMDRVAFIRQLQRAQADRQYKHVSSQTGSELSSTGAVDLSGKIDLLASAITQLARSGRGRSRTPPPRSASLGALPKSVPPGPRVIPPRVIPPRRQMTDEGYPEVGFAGSYMMGGSSGSGYR